MEYPREGDIISCPEFEKGWHYRERWGHKNPPLYVGNHIGLFNDDCPAHDASRGKAHFVVIGTDNEPQWNPDMVRNRQIEGHSFKVTAKRLREGDVYDPNAEEIEFYYGDCSNYGRIDGPLVFHGHMQRTYIREG